MGPQGIGGIELVCGLDLLSLLFFKPYGQLYVGRLFASSPRGPRDFDTDSCGDISNGPFHRDSREEVLQSRL